MWSRAGLSAAGGMLLVAAALPFGGTAHATARTAAAPASGAPSALVLTVAPGQARQTVGVDRAVTLSCTPSPAGSHPAPQQACDELTAADGDISALPAQPQKYCSMIFAPVVVTVQGVWRGERVDYARSYPNQCVMQARGGPLYAF